SFMPTTWELVMTYASFPCRSAIQPLPQARPSRVVTVRNAADFLTRSITSWRKSAGRGMLRMISSLSGASAVRIVGAAGAVVSTLVGGVGGVAGVAGAAVPIGREAVAVWVSASVLSG